MESSTMAEVLSKFESTYQVEAEPYQVEHLRLAAGTDVASLAVMQEAVNRGARQSGKLVGVAKVPTSQGVFASAQATSRS
jgi:hypothetical protein